MSKPDFKLLKRKFLLAVALLATSGLLMSSLAAYAQSSPPFAVETNISGLYAYTQPPEGFDPMTASAAELKLYGYPPRPGTDESDKALAVWKAAVNPALRRVVPKLVRTNIYHRPASGLAINNAQNTTSSNWSGYALTQTKATFASAAGAWAVPVVQPPFGTCSGEVYYSSQWVGIDGYSNSELFQAGSNTAVVCANGYLETNYVPWVEWLPAAQVNLTENDGSALPFAPGDYVVVMVTATNWADGASSTGELYFADITQNWSISIPSFSATEIGGTYVLGRSAEWIVERPEINGAFSTLANYITVPWSMASAGGFNNTVYAPAVPKSSKVYNITMLDNNSQPISYVDLFSPDVLWFFDEGSAKN